MAEAHHESGLLPAWREEDLPAPPVFNLRNALAVIGPGTIALSMSIGSGEWLLGPATIVKYGFPLLWIATVSILLQVVLNLEFIRYTLYTGEPIVTGFMRTWPGPGFWAVVYIILALLHVGWPGWAATSASTIFSAFYGHIPGPADRGTMLLFGYLTFALAILIVLFGGKIERMLEWVNWFIVGWIVLFLLIVDLFFVPARVWWEGFLGLFQFGSLPAGADWFLLGAFAAYAGAGGIGNCWLTNWFRDKGFAMGKVVGFIPSAVGGRMVKVSPIGAVFRPTTENLGKWREWWKYTDLDQWGVWMIGCFLGMYLNVILAAAIIPKGTAITGLAAGAYQAEYLAKTVGRAFWFLTLLNGFWILWGTQLAVIDGFVRLATDILWTGSETLRRWAKEDIRKVYYGVLILFALWGCIALNLAQPLILIMIGANMAAFIFVVAGIHVLVVNRKFLPKEVRSAPWRQGAVGLAVLFFGFFVVMNAGRQLGLW